MSLLDIAVVVPLLLFALRGFKNGLVKELFGTVGLILAIFFSLRYMGVLSDYLSAELHTNSPVLPYFSFGIIFLLTMVAMQIVIFFVESVMKIAYLGIPNRVLGSAFSALKAGLLISLLFLLVSGFNLPDHEARSDSRFYPYVIRLAPLTYDILARFYPGTVSYIDTVQNVFHEHSPL